MAIDPFVDERLPEQVERGARGGPEFRTGVRPLDSGYESRNAFWAQPRQSWDISYGVQYKEDMEEVRDFFYARMGRLVGFRFKDWSDYEVDVLLATGTSGDTRTSFQAFKSYSSGGFSFNRTLRKLVAGTVEVRKNGALLPQGPGAGGYQVDVNTGIITLGTALVLNDQLRLKAEFDVPVRFMNDRLDVQMETFQAGSIPAIPIIELKLRTT